MSDTHGDGAPRVGAVAAPSLPRHDPTRRGFASDNYAGMHPEVLAALAVANGGHQGAYGTDVYTARLQEVVVEQFGVGARCYPVFNGTGANVVALQSMVPRWGAVVVADTAHVHVDEGGAPERVGGLKLLAVATPDGKLTPELLDTEAWGFGDVHRAQPSVVSVTQPTEVGTLYSLDELRALSDHAHALGLLVHLDGARLFNAAAALGCTLGELTRGVGVDVVSLGGTKAGAMLAEAVVVLGSEPRSPGVAASSGGVGAAGGPDAVAGGLPFVRKFDMQLASKMRFVSAQLLALLDGGLGLRAGAHANAMAATLRAGVEGVVAELGERGVAVPIVLTQPTQANAVFLTLPRAVAERVRERFAFYDWDEARGEVRWMCAFDTTEADVAALLDALRRACLVP